MPIHIIFDADDTLWQTEYLYDEARERVVKLLVNEGLGLRGDIDQLAREIDKRNFGILGFSKERFPTSLAETYRELCNRKKLRPKARLLREITALGRSVFETPATPIEGVEATLTDLKSRGCELLLWTQGDKAVQRQRLQASKVKDIFGEKVEVTDSKSPEALEELLEKYQIDKKNAWLVGNSIKSDINPALKKNVRAIWIPNHVWDREKEALEIPLGSREFVYQADNIRDVPKIVLRADNDQEIEKQAEPKNSVVYLFISAYQDLYRQYILDILAYPRGFIFRFPYDSKWLPSPYRDSPEKQNKFVDSLKDKNALIVFVDERTDGEPRRNQRFFPIRAGKINGSPKLQEGLMLQIEFTLGDYVLYQDNNSVNKYHAEIETLAARPRYHVDDCAYVSIGPDHKDRIATQDQPGKDDNAWKSIVDWLGQLNSTVRGKQNSFTPIPTDPFEKAMFFRIVGLEQLSPKRKAVKSATFLDNESGYELADNKNYRLNLLFYSPRRPHPSVQHSKISARIDSEFVKGIGKLDIPLNFRYDERHIDFLTDRVFTDTWANITLAATNGSASEGHERIVTPEPALLIKIRATKWAIAAPILFILATIISSLNEELAGFFATTRPHLKDPISSALAIVGYIVSTALLFYLYRKLK